MAAIYYADDEQDIRELVSAWLKSDGHEVTAFETGDALLTAFRERPCDLVILDIMMPGTDGIGILTALRRESRVPVILLTAKDTGPGEGAAQARGDGQRCAGPERAGHNLRKFALHARQKSV